jgi:hypothetical protein
MLAENVMEVCGRTIRPEKKTLAYSFFQSPEEDQFLGCFGRECNDTFLVALDDYDIADLDRKLVTNLKKDEVILRLYSDRIGYIGFAIFNFLKGKVRYQIQASYECFDEYKFERYWYKPNWMRIKHGELTFFNSYTKENS